jgi:hypothetical protein
MSDNDKTVTSTEFQKVEQKPQDAQGVKVIKSLDTSSTYVNLKRIVSNLTNKDSSATKE